MDRDFDLDQVPTSHDGAPDDDAPLTCTLASCALGGLPAHGRWQVRLLLPEHARHSEVALSLFVSIRADGAHGGGGGGEGEEEGEEGPAWRARATAVSVKVWYIRHCNCSCV